jgi:hypothetical protein
MCGMIDDRSPGVEPVGANSETEEESLVEWRYFSNLLLNFLKSRAYWSEIG